MPGLSATEGRPIYESLLPPKAAGRAAPSPKTRRCPTPPSDAGRRTRLLACLLALALTNACATSGGPRISQTSTANGMVVSRQLAREVLLQVRGESAVLGKVTGLDGDVATFLPSPYWNVESRTIAVDDIVLVESQGMEGTILRSVVLGSAGSFVLVGILAGAAAEYDTDYESALSSAAVAGVLGGLVGAVVGGIRSNARKRTYRFEGMSPPEKRNAIRQIMAR